MVPPKFANDQIRRLAGLDQFPMEPAAAAELVEWLMHHASDERTGAEFIDAWLRTNPQAPKPSDIYEHFHPPSSYQGFAASREVKCQICGDTGFRVVERKGGVTAAEKCECQGAVK